MTKRKILFALFVAATVINSFAAGNGMAGINEATSMVSGYFDPGTKLVYAIGAVVGLIGGVQGFPAPIHILRRRRTVAFGLVGLVGVW